jgi:hypothetical protein
MLIRLLDSLEFEAKCPEKRNAGMEEGVSKLRIWNTDDKLGAEDKLEADDASSVPKRPDRPADGLQIYSPAR